MSTKRPLTDKEIRALVNDAVDLTLPQARGLFAQYQQVELDMPTDNYAATLTNLLDAIFYMRFGGQWRATAAPHAFQPTPLATLERKPPVSKHFRGETSLIRNMSRALFG
jgi:hypothetical protein